MLKCLNFDYNRTCNNVLNKLLCTTFNKEIWRFLKSFVNGNDVVSPPTLPPPHTHKSVNLFYQSQTWIRNSKVLGLILWFNRIWYLPFTNYRSSHDIPVWPPDVLLTFFHPFLMPWGMVVSKNGLLWALLSSRFESKGGTLWGLKSERKWCMFIP